MIDLYDIRYVRLGTRNLASASHYIRDVVGLEFVREEAGAQYFRSDDRDHTLVYFDGDPRDQVVGFELRSATELDHAAALLSDSGVDVQAGTSAECEQRHVRAMLRFDDPSGNHIDLVVDPHHSGRRHFPSRDAGVTGFSHIGLCTTDATRDERFWTEVLGARVSDRIGDAPLLRIDEVHHKVALFPSTHPGIQHVNHQVASTDDVMRAWYLLKSRGVRIVFGPGRHPTSGAVFLYFEGPDGMVYEYSSGVRHIAAAEEPLYHPRQFPRENKSFCMWGAVPDIEEFRS